MEKENFQQTQALTVTYDSQNPYNLQPPVTSSITKPQAVYGEVDRVFAVIAMILGFAFLKVLVHSDNVFIGSSAGFGFMTTVVCVGVTLFNWFYSKKKGLGGSKENTFIFFVTLFLSCLFVISDNDVKEINLCIVLVSNLYFVYASYKSNNNSVILNVFKAVLKSPFYEYGSLFGALFQKPKIKSDRKNTVNLKKNVMPIVLGIMLSIPVCVVVMSLLMSSDSNFGTLFNDILESFSDWFFSDLFGNLLYLFFSIPISMYIFGAVFSRAYKMDNENRLTKLPKTSMRVLPSAMCNAFLSPLIFIYIAFVFTQISYLFATVDTLSDTFDYSDYARSGFFELCFVALINLSVIAAIMFFVKTKDKALPKSVKAFIISFCVLTLCLIITAIVKMMMYINMFGMTPLRVYTLIFMIYLFVMFIVLIVKQFRFSLSFTKVAYVLAVAVVIGMSVLPIDGYIARYNIEKYNKGEIGWIGYEAMYQLDSSAVSVFAEYPELHVYDGKFEDGYDYDVYPIKVYFSGKSSSVRFDIYNFNFTRYFASKIIDDFNSKHDVVQNYGLIEGEQR